MLTLDEAWFCLNDILKKSNFLNQIREENPTKWFVDVKKSFCYGGKLMIMYKVELK